MIEGMAAELANRASRRSFLGRTAKILVGVVGGGVAAGAMAQPAHAGCSCGNPIPCEYIYCPCVGGRIALANYCGSCLSGCFHSYSCTTITCATPAMSLPRLSNGDTRIRVLA